MSKQENPCKTEPRISFVVIAYKVEQYLEGCLDSILRDPGTDFEVLVVEDVSPDSTGAIIDSYAAKDPRVRAIHREKNGGPSAARNTGLENARGTWVSFIDGDDLLADNAVAILRGHVNSDADLVIFGTNTFYSGQPIPRYTPSFSPMVVEGNEMLREYKLMLLDPAPPAREDYRYIHRTAPWARLFCRRFLEANKLFFDETLKRSEDHVFAFHCSHFLKKIEIVNDWVYTYRIGVGVSYRFSPDALETHTDVFCRIQALLEKFSEEDDPELCAIMQRRYQCSSVYTMDLSICHPDCPWSKMQQQQWLEKFCASQWVQEAAKANSDRSSTQLNKAILEKDRIQLMHICDRKRAYCRFKQKIKKNPLGKKLHFVYRIIRGR